MPFRHAWWLNVVQFVQTKPPVPQKPSWFPGSQVLPEQQPAQVCGEQIGPGTHLWPRQASFGAHAWHARPAPPHAADVSPFMQVPPAQHPDPHVRASQIWLVQVPPFPAGPAMH